MTFGINHQWASVHDTCADLHPARGKVFCLIFHWMTICVQNKCQLPKVVTCPLVGSGDVLAMRFSVLGTGQGLRPETQMALRCP